MRVNEESVEMSLEMSQQSELATGARGSDTRSRHEQAGEDSTDTAGQSISKRRKWSSGARRPRGTRSVMQRRLQESQVADVHVRDVTAVRGMA